MTRNRIHIYFFALLTLPLIVAFYDVSVISALTIIIIMLIWRWGISLSGLIKPAPIPKLQLDTISASHFVEKVRWSMDLLELEYTERSTAGTMGLFFTGRTVPQLKIHTGFTQSVISNSSDILRYLWGQYGAQLPDKAAFLTPTPERLALEKKIDEYGRNLQIWGYTRLAGHKQLTLQLWGKNCPLLPAWQRHTVSFLYPVLQFLIGQAFQLNDKNLNIAVKNIDDFLLTIEDKLTADSQSILSGDQFDYVDIAFASISGLWLLPEGYGGGMADGVKIEHSALPKIMQDEVTHWKERYPKSVALIERCYKNRNIKKNTSNAE